MKTDPNDQAFPGDGDTCGLTIREYFAIHALAGILAHPEQNLLGMPIGLLSHVNQAVAAADLLIDELNKQESSPKQNGWRLVEKDELLQSGDERLNLNGLFPKWFLELTINFGTPLVEGMIVRRRIGAKSLYEKDDG